MNDTQLEKNFDRISDWIKITDQKVSVFLAFQGIILTLIFPFLYASISNFKFYYNRCSFAPVILGVSCIITGILISIISITPKLGHTRKKSLLYFKDVASMKFEDYKKNVKDTSAEKYKDFLLEQIYVLSCIATKKNQQFVGAVIVFTLGISLIAVWLIII